MTSDAAEGVGQILPGTVEAVEVEASVLHDGDRKKLRGLRVPAAEIGPGEKDEEGNEESGEREKAVAIHRRMSA